MNVETFFFFKYTKNIEVNSNFVIFVIKSAFEAEGNITCYGHSLAERANFILHIMVPSGAERTSKNLSSKNALHTPIILLSRIMTFSGHMITIYTTHYKIINHIFPSV